MADIINGLDDKQLKIIINAGQSGIAHADVPTGYTLTFDHTAQIIYAGGNAYDFHTLSGDQFEKLLSILPTGESQETPQNIDQIIGLIRDLQSGQTGLHDRVSANETGIYALTGIAGTLTDDLSGLTGIVGQHATRIGDAESAIENLQTGQTGLHERVAKNTTGIFTLTGIIGGPSGIGTIWGTSGIAGLWGKIKDFQDLTGTVTSTDDDNVQVSVTTEGGVVTAVDVISDAIDSAEATAIASGIAAAMNSYNIPIGGTGISGIATIDGSSTIAETLAKLQTEISALSGSDNENLDTILAKINAIKAELQDIDEEDGDLANTLLDALSKLQIRASGATGITGAVSTYKGIKADGTEGIADDPEPLQTSLKNLSDLIKANASGIESNRSGVEANRSGIDANAADISKLTTILGYATGAVATGIGTYDSTDLVEVDVTTHTGSVSQVKVNVSGLSAILQTFSGNIAAVSGNIATVSGNVSALEGKVGNATGIAERLTTIETSLQHATGIATGIGTRLTNLESAAETMSGQLANIISWEIIGANSGNSGN